jgi:hypothetical protein
MCPLLVLSCYLSYSSAHCCLLDIFNFIEHCSMLQGAVENVLERSSFMQLLDGSVVELDQHSRDLILERLREMSTSALRCLGFAYKDELLEFETYNSDEDHPAHQLLLDPSNYSLIENKLIFVGLVGLRVSCLNVYGLLYGVKVLSVSFLFIFANNNFNDS